MSAIKNYYHDQICAGDNDEPINYHQPGFDKDVWFQDADSGMWYSNLSDSDNIMAVRVNGVEFTNWWKHQDDAFIDSLDSVPF